MTALINNIVVFLISSHLANWVFLQIMDHGNIGMVFDKQFEPFHLKISTEMHIIYDYLEGAQGTIDSDGRQTKLLS